MKKTKAIKVAMKLTKETVRVVADDRLPQANGALVPIQCTLLRTGCLPPTC